MKVNVRIPRVLRGHTGGQAIVELEAATVPNCSIPFTRPTRACVNH